MAVRIDAPVVGAVDVNGVVLAVDMRGSSGPQD